MKIISLLIFTLLLVPVSILAEQESVNDLAVQGSAAFARGDFDTAYELYGKALAMFYTGRKNMRRPWRSMTRQLKADRHQNC
jgi:hypothetical protein